jgi:hypothetical protein
MPSSSPVVRAQAVTVEPESTTEPSVTEVATEAPEPTSEPSVVVTETPQAEATQVVTETPVSEVTEAPSVEVTEAPSVEVTEAIEVTETVNETNPEMSTVITSFVDDFDAFTGDKWSLLGWEALNGTLSSMTPNANATILDFSPTDFVLTAQLFVDANNIAVIAFRSDAEEYRAMFSSNGSSRLYRGDTLLDMYVMPVADAGWFAVQIVAAGDTMSVSVNDVTGIVFTDSAALNVGRISFRTGEANNGSVLLDNLSVSLVDAATVVFPEEVAVADATPQAETTVEAEVTLEAEITPEVEVTEEAPLAAEVETPSELADALTFIANGQPLVAQVILDAANYQFDDANRIGLKIYAANGVYITEVEQFLQTLNADIQTVEEAYLTAFVPIENLAVLMESALVSQITKPATARSTGPVASPSNNPTGTVYSEGFDVLGALDWHHAGFTGSNVRVGIIDTEFDGNGLGAEFSCLAAPGNNGESQAHGLTMVEIICDIAPNAQVYTYSLDSLGAYASLATNVYQAITDQIDVLLIAAEITDAVPGDGTGLEDGLDDPYIALASARNQGMVIFAGAGNFGQRYQGGVAALERSVTLSVPAASFGEAVATIKMRATPGDDIIVMWNDWTGLGNAANLEDFDIKVRLDPALNGGSNDIIEDNNFRNSLLDKPSHALNLAPSVGAFFKRCPVDASIGGGEYDPTWCYVEVIITRHSGDSPVTMQVFVAPQQQSAVDPSWDGISDPVFLKEHLEHDIEITGLTLGTGVTQISNTGTLARPADSPDVITVGAVCASEAGNFVSTPDSSLGPIYNANGAASTISITAPTNRNETKPDIVSVSYINTSGSSGNAALCDGTVAGIKNAGGAGGTSTSAAHVAGMTALLLSNPSFSNLNADGVRDYLQSHAVELPLGSAANGFDMSHGAGFSILGSPNYKLSNTQNPASAPDLLNCAGILYVGQANMNSTADGSLAQPYTNIPQAITNSSVGDCIVVMPGEYVTPIQIQQNNVKLYSYNGASSSVYPASLIYVSGQYLAAGAINVDGIGFGNNAGIYINSAVSGTRIDGFTFISSDPYTAARARRQAIFAYNSNNTQIINNSFGAITVDGSSYNGFDAGDTTPIIIYQGYTVSLESNTFRANVGGILFNGKMATPSIAVLNAGLAGPIVLRYNVFDSNTALEVQDAGTYDYFASVLYSANSYADIVGNTFISNQANTIINVRTADAGIERVRVVSNLFQNNRMDTARNGVDVADLAGTLVHGYFIPNLSFVNNTVVLNNFTDSGANGAILGRGSRTGSGGGVASTQVFDFANNLVYNNTFVGGAGVFSSQGTTVTQCDSLLGGTDTATIRNWWYNYSYSSCTSAMAANNNETASSPASVFLGAVNNRPDAVTDSLYYALTRVVDNPEPTPDVYSLGIDYSNIDTSAELGNNINLSAAPFEFDILSEARISNTAGWELNSNASDTGTYRVDVGAFEFSSLTVGNPYIDGTSYFEDQALIVINLDPGISGGVGQLTLDYLPDTLDEDSDGNTTEIKPSSLPSNYGTQCGVEFTQANHGLVFGTGLNNLKAFYCPPANFYTDNADSYSIPDNVSFGFSVTDETNFTVFGSTQFKITALPDIALSASQDIAADDQVIIANIGQTGVKVRLRPFVDFNNFAFSEYNNPAFFDGSNYAIDYPFIYTYTDGTYSGNDIFVSGPTKVTGANPNEVYIQFDLNSNASGAAVITYTVSDGTGSSTNSFTVRTVNRIPETSGLYDDSSFAFDYTDGWKIENAPDAINNTLHNSQVIGDVANFGFRGTGFVLYMKGAGTILGGSWNLNLYIGSSTTAATFSTWQAVSSGIYRAIASDGGDVKFECTSTAIDPLASELTSKVNGYYTVTCNSFDDSVVTANGIFDDGETAATDTHLVEIENTFGRKITVDAFSLINDNESPITVDIPLPPGVHDVDELALRDAFGSNWQEVFSSTYSNGRAYQLTTFSDGANDRVSFHVRGGTGFAIGTTIQSAPTDFTVCVTNTSTSDLTCQSYGYDRPATLAATTNAFRPFYGLTPDLATTYRVDIIPANNLLVIDSVIVYDPSVAPTAPISGGIDDADIDYLVLSGGLDPNWELNAATRGVWNSTLTSISRNVRAPGPYATFQVDGAIDTVYWTFGGRSLSNAVMICVDRGLGVGSNADVATEPGSGEISTAHGNCIMVDLNTGLFSVIGTDGIPTAGTTPDGTNSLRLVANTIILDETLFRDDVNDAPDAKHWIGTATHTFEIFALHDVKFSFDRIVAIGSGVPLTAGRYEEFMANIDYLKADFSPATVISSTSIRAIDYTGDFTQILGNAALRDFGSGVMFTNDYHNAIAFKFIGTGFAPAFRLNLTSEEVLICWQPSADFTTYANLLANGTCQRFDNEDRRASYNAPRPILGLPSNTYTAIIRFEGDNFSPAANRALEPEMWFDGVTIYNDDLTGLNQLVAGATYEANYLNRGLLNNFAYFGNGWNTLSGIRARNYSNQDIDTISRGDVGATVAFRTTGTNAITLVRELSIRNANYLVCATNEADATDRQCQFVSNAGRGYKNEITVYLTNSTVAPFGNYMVTISTIDSNVVSFDAVRPMRIINPLTEGIYDDNNPAIIYHYGSRNIVPNGDMEKDNGAVIYWDADGSPTGNLPGINKYTGRYSRDVTTDVGSEGIVSQSFTLQAGVPYSVVARVYVDILTPGTVTMQLGANTASSDITRLAVWQTIRFDYTPVSTEINQTLRFLASTGMHFFVDDVQVVENSNWITKNDIRAYGAYRTISTSHGSFFSFGFTGTGFALGIPVDRDGGEVQVCYASYTPASGLPAASTVESSGTCITYENETTRANSDNMRLIEGLPYGNYAVVVRDAEDGNTVTGLSYPAIRNSRNSVGLLALDYVHIFDTTSIVAVTESNIYNENAADAFGNVYLQLVPQTNWDSISGRTAARYSEQSYVTVVDANSRPNRNASGPAALLKLDLLTYSSARVIVDVYAASRIASNQLLACVDGVDGDIVYDGLTKTYNIVDSNGPVNCVILADLTTSRFITLSPDNLPLLGLGGSERILTIQTLSGSAFLIDSYQVLYGNNLLPGFYEETIGTDILGASSEWTKTYNLSYSAGSALVLKNPDSLNPTPTATMSFMFDGTGFSLVSAFASNGGNFDIAVTNQGSNPAACNGLPSPTASTININDTGISTLGTTVYGATITYAGLPCDTYLVTLTANAALSQQVVFDAVEIYGPMQVLGSLYDDALLDTNGVAYITYGPTTTAWTVKTGISASTALNRTLHVAQRQGAVASFQIGTTNAALDTVSTPAKGIVLYNGAGTASIGHIEVCFRDVTNPGAALDCQTPVIGTAAGSVAITPSNGDGAYYVTVTLVASAKTFALDAVQVLEAGLHEGIFDASEINADLTTAYTGTGALNSTTNTIELASGDSVSFDVTGVALSVVLSQTTTSSKSYTMCIEDAGTCDVVNESLPVSGDIVPTSGLSAITYAGLHNSDGTERTLTVKLTNDGSGTLFIKELHVLSGDPSLNITDTARYENTDPRIRYLPFGSLVENINTRGHQSEGSEHSGSMQGATVYFEFTDLSSLSAPGFEYIRQMATAYGKVEICYGQIGDGINVTATQSSSDVRGSCATVANNAVAAYQVAESIATSNSCQYGCWATIRSVDNLVMPFDYVRLYDAGAVLTEGYYEDSYPGLNYEDDAGGSWNSSPLANRLASGGFVSVTTVNDTLNSENGPVMWFVMNGTAFSVDFTADSKADAVEICYRAGTQATFADVKTNVLNNGTCQTFDNENRRTTYGAARTIAGLPDGIYTVAVRMLPDNNSPAPHSTVFSPISMMIDSVQVFKEDWASLVAVSPGAHYETSYDAQNLTNNFFYIGDGWSSVKGARARNNSSQNYDTVREYGSGVVFHTQGADAVTLYTDLRRGYANLRMCAVPVNAGISGITGEVKCLDFSLDGSGYQQALSFRFHDYGLVAGNDYMVSIFTLDAGQFNLDAIELSLGNTLTEGFYEGTNANLYYDNHYTDYVVNGAMEANSNWIGKNNPTIAIQSSLARFEGRYGWHVEGDTGQGIESAGFNLTEAGVIYTLQARVRVASGGVRVRLVEGTQPTSIQEFSLIEPTAGVTGTQWTTIRVDFALDGGNVPYTDLRLQFLANGSNTRFDVDDVRLTQGALWAGIYNRNYSEGNIWHSLTPGASLSFSFEGTGVEIGTLFDANGGEMELCYDDDITFDETSETAEQQSCFTYQQEDRRATSGVARMITGLPFDIYYVRIRDVEDGFTTSGRILKTNRNSRNPIGQIAIDYIRVVSNPLLLDVANAVIPMSDLVTPAGYYNENVINPLTNKPYLQLYPEQDWASQSGNLARKFTNQSYMFVADSNGRAARNEAGQAAVLYVAVPADGATIVLYTGGANRSASSQMLICAGDTMSGEIVQEEIVNGLLVSLAFALESPTTPSDCILRDMKTDNALVVSSEDLAALGTAGIQRVMFTTLTTGEFNIDGYQVIHGDTLAPGIYDDFLPDNLLNFDSNSSDSVSDLVRGCDLDNFWCVKKVASSFGGQLVQTQNLNATLNFNIEGTGFSVLTEVASGAQMRVCYAETPTTGTVSFPTRADTLNGNTFSWDNNTQDLSTGGIWCELFTTNTATTHWNVLMPDRINPLRGEQYGFSFYGLPYGNYSVEVLMFEALPTLTVSALSIDAIAVFGDYNQLPIMDPGLYDDSEAELSLEPVTSWSTTISRIGPPRGPYNFTETTASNAGSIAQMQVDGNSVTLFQTVDTRNTADARICVVVTNTVIHCTPEAATSAVGIQNPDASAPPYALAVELASFSQSGRRAYFTPIMFYGLGISDMTYPHRIIIENRNHGRQLSIDAILVQD